MSSNRRTTTLYLGAGQAERLRALSARTGAPMAKHVRVALGSYLDANEKLWSALAEATRTDPAFLESLTLVERAVLPRMLGMPSALDGKL